MWAPALAPISYGVAAAGVRQGSRARVWWSATLNHRPALGRREPYTQWLRTSILMVLNFCQVWVWNKQRWPWGHQTCALGVYFYKKTQGWHILTGVTSLAGVTYLAGMTYLTGVTYLAAVTYLTWWHIWQGWHIWQEWLIWQGWLIWRMWFIWQEWLLWQGWLICQGWLIWQGWLPSFIVINHNSVSLTVTEIWPIKKFDGWFDHDLISQDHHKYVKWYTISHCYQSQVCIFNGCWDISNWKFWRSIWPWPTFSRSSQIWQMTHSGIISYCY